MIKITEKNILDFPIGTEVVLNWGAYHPIEEGLVVDYSRIPASKHFPAKYELVVETENGRIHNTALFVDSGIGTYLKKDYFKV